MGYRRAHPRRRIWREKRLVAANSRASGTAENDSRCSPEKYDPKIEKAELDSRIHEVREPRPWAWEQFHTYRHEDAANGSRSSSGGRASLDPTTTPENSDSTYSQFEPPAPSSDRAAPHSGDFSGSTSVAVDGYGGHTVDTYKSPPRSKQTPGQVARSSSACTRPTGTYGSRQSASAWNSRAVYTHGREASQASVPRARVSRTRSFMVPQKLTDADANSERPAIGIVR